jgi:hypothetical protein
MSGWRDEDELLREIGLPEPPPWLADRVLDAIEADEVASQVVVEPPRRLLRAWHLAAAAVAAFALGAGLFGVSDAPPLPTVEPGDTPVRFVYVGDDGERSVRLVGDFNDWGAEPMELEPTEVGGVFAVTVALPPGEHEYMFVVDGKRWVTDPLAARHRPDGFGRTNSVISL